MKLSIRDRPRRLWQVSIRASTKMTLSLMSRQNSGVKVLTPNGGLTSNWDPKGKGTTLNRRSCVSTRSACDTEVSTANLGRMTTWILTGKKISKYFHNLRMTITSKMKKIIKWRNMKNLRLKKPGLKSNVSRRNKWKNLREAWSLRARKVSQILMRMKMRNHTIVNLRLKMNL